MDRLRNWALRLIIGLNIVALVVSFYESFAGLFQWAHHHSVTGLSAALWPLMIDVIILVGEAGLFIAHHGHWRVRDKVWMWFVTLTALGVSMAANIGHVLSTDWLSHLTASLPPAALFFSMTVGFGVMKRVYLNKPAGPVPAQEIPIGTVPLTRPAERAHVGESPWVSAPGLTTEMRPISRTETKPESAPEVPDPFTDEADANETRAQQGFKIIPGKSYTMPKDPRDLGNDLTRIRVRDMYDVDPDIVPNAIAKTLGISWATADKYLKETKEARGL